MILARRILSPLLVLVGFCFVAAGLYRAFIFFSASGIDWVLVAIGTVLMVAGLLLQASALWQRVLAAGLALAGVLLFALGYPLYGMAGIGLIGFTSLLWIPAVALGAAALLVARGRSWQAMLTVIPLVAVYVVVGLLVGNGPVGWWPVNVRLPRPMMEWLAMSGAGFWVVQVILIVVLVALTALVGGLIDRRGTRAIPGQPDGTMVG